MRPIPGMHPLPSCIPYGLFQDASDEYEMSGGASPVLFSLSACAGGGQTTMNITKQICLTALVCVMVLCLKGEEKMPRKQARTTSNASQTETAVAGTGNLSKKRREELIGKINEIRAFLEQSGDTNAARLITFASELEKEVRQKKYGLVFEEHKERVDVVLENNLPVLTENKSRFIDKGGELNFLIEGDNLAALKLLEKTHKGKIDLIYIDPPYNTGNKDFVYNDSYVEKEDTFRHSKWLSFMRKRLEAARCVMSQRGVMFISIDDNEQAALKILCDDVFGAENFIAQMIWQQGKKSSGNLIGVNHEYVLVYAKYRSLIDKPMVAWAQRKGGLDRIYQKYNQLKKTYGADIKTIEKEIRKWFAQLPENDPAYGSKHYSHVDERGLFFPDNSCAPDRPETRCHKPLIHPITGKKTAVPSLGWRWKEATLDRMVDTGQIYFGENEKCVPKVKKYLIDMEYELPTSVFYRDGRGASKEVDDIVGKGKFDNPKDRNELERFIAFRPNALILDFFAGSGTTGHAVMNLNAKDHGKRKFILVTNNENDICEKVTYERLKRVIKKEGYKARLKYFKIDYVPIARKVYFEYADELLKHIRELVELENAIDFSKDETIAITVTDKEFEKFVANEKKMEGKKAVYVGHDVLIGAKAKKVLQGKGIEIRIIPEYYYAEQEG